MPRLVSDRSAPGQCQPAHAGRVLLVDQSDDSRDVIRTVLERRGVEILEASNASAGLELLREHHPNVVVLDADGEPADTDQFRAVYDSELTSNEGEMLILGNIDGDQICSGQHVVRKPYHYGPLIQRIEELVKEQKAGRH